MGGALPRQQSAEGGGNRDILQNILVPVYHCRAALKRPYHDFHSNSPHKKDRHNPVCIVSFRAKILPGSAGECQKTFAHPFQLPPFCPAGRSALQAGFSFQYSGYAAPWQGPRPGEIPGAAPGVMPGRYSSPRVMALTASVRSTTSERATQPSVSPSFWTRQFSPSYW